MPRRTVIAVLGILTLASFLDAGRNAMEQWQALLPGEATVLVLAGGLVNLGLSSLAMLLLLCTASRWRRLKWLYSVPFLGGAAALVLVGSAARIFPLRPMEIPVLRPDAGPSVLLLTLDTFRADHMSAIGGYRRDVRTPHLDALAAEGALFTQAETTVPLTLPAHAAMLTGRPTCDLGVVANGEILRDEVRTVAMDFADAGYRTGAFISAGVLNHVTGIGRGFQHYDDRFGTWDLLLDISPMQVLTRLGPRESPIHHRFQRGGEATVARALAWWRQDPGPTFMWVHLYDPHSPYRPPPPYDTMYPWDFPDAPGNPEVVRAARRRLEAGGLLNAEIIDVAPDIRREIALYAGEIAWTDELVGRLVDGLPPDLSILVAGDHGESLDEHDYLLNHGARLYEPSTRVPLILRAGGVPEGLRVESAVSTLRVAATLRALGGLEPRAPSLLEACRASPDDISREELLTLSPHQQSRLSLSLVHPFRVAWRRGDDKWIIDAKGHVEQYDLGADPQELENAAGRRPAERVTMLARGLATIDSLQACGEATRNEISFGAVQALGGLGYLEER